LAEVLALWNGADLAVYDDFNLSVG